MDIDYSCQVCEQKNLSFISQFQVLPRITSDCRPFPSGGQVSVCTYCGAVQKIPDLKWKNEITEIYKNYYAYQLADGKEQMVLDPITALPKKRSEVIIYQLKNLLQLPKEAAILDIGCGEGNTLETISKEFPLWELYGHELSEKEKTFSHISQFKRLYTCEISNIDNEFDFIFMIHSLEHFVDPSATLLALKNKLKPNGYLFIQVCNIEENPFDLLIADHLMHFSPASLTSITKKTGFSCKSINTNWVKKEISFLANKTDKTDYVQKINNDHVIKNVHISIAWLSHLIEEARSIANTTNLFGIFGTSVAASWLASELGEKVKFFVDEDPYRIGRQYMQKPVLSASQIPKAALVYLALAPSIAKQIAERLKHESWSFVGSTI